MSTPTPLIPADKALAWLHPWVLPGQPLHYSEWTQGGASTAALWQQFFAASGVAQPEGLNARAAQVRHRVREDGASYNVFGDGDEATRPWPLELLPMLLSPTDWAQIASGAVQRARLMNATLADVYGPRHLLNEGLLPPQLVLAHPQYLRALHGVRPLGGVHLHVLALDLARGPEGRWWVLAQRTQAPSGLGYLLENRAIVGPQFPDSLRALQVQRLDGAYRAFMQGLLRLSPAGERSRVVLLTPGRHNETYFEQVFLARHLGLTLVEGSDLTVRANRVYLKTLHGLEPVHVVLRRVDDEFLDPLELRGDSTLGVPGLLQAMRSGQVVVANAPGAGWLESPGLAAFWPGVAERLLGETLSLPASEAWWCGERSVWQTFKADLSGFVVAPTFTASGTTHSFAPRLADALSPAARAEWVRAISADPAAHTLQARVRPSETPVWRGGHLAAHPAVLRVFVLSDGQGGWQAVPGGLVRIAAQGDGGDDPWLSMQRGSASADAWVVGSTTPAASAVLAAAEPADVRPPLREPLSRAALAQAPRIVTSRAAENLFWLGRYTERADAQVALARLMVAEPTDAPAPLWAALEHMARMAGLVDEAAPPWPNAAALVSNLSHQLGDAQGSVSVAYNLQCLKACASGLRDRLASEHWALIHEAEANVRQRLGPAAQQAASPPDTLAVLTFSAMQLAAITGAQTDRMMRDDGWRLLSVGRHIERMDYLAQVLDIGLAHGLPDLDEGAAALLQLFDATITFRAQFQGRREVLPLLHLLVHDADSPRSLAWVASTLKNRLRRLAHHDPDWAEAWAQRLPNPASWLLPESLADQQGVAALREALRVASAQMAGLSDAIAQRLFAHISMAFSPEVHLRHTYGLGGTEQ